MKLLILHKVERWDGAERQVFRGEASLERHVAEALAGKHDNVRREEIRLYESVQDFNDSQKSALIERALAKLTPEEAHALGFSRG